MSVAIVAASARFAQKAFQRDDLADAAIKLEAQIKAESGAVTRARRRRCGATPTRRSSATTSAPACRSSASITVVAPEDSANWLRIAQTVLQIRPGNVRERTTLLERAATAAYIAYQRTKSPAEEAESLLIISRSYADRQLWRPALDAMRLSLDLREVADVRQQYERMREDHGFRLLDYSVDADAASPRACFQFSEDLPGRRTDLSPFVAVSGQDRPALTVDTRQLCVEGLKHGERYTITLRAGIPSTVRETLAKPAEFNIYVRDRKPLVRFSGRAYVLPRVGQRGIPVVSVNTSAVAIEVYRIGDRNLVSTVLGHDFQRTLNRYELARLREDRGSQVWKGEMKVEPVQNADVTTAFPVSEAIPNLARRRLRHGGERRQRRRRRLRRPRDPVVHRLRPRAHRLFRQRRHPRLRAFARDHAGRQRRRGAAALAQQRGARRPSAPTMHGYVQFEAALTRGEVGAAPAMLVATDAKGDYAFLSLRSPAFDLSDRGVSGRNAPSGLDGFVYTERGVYRSGENVHVTALLRDAQGMAAAGVPLTLVVERPDGVEYRRVTVADQGVGGRCARSAAGAVGADRHLARARLHRSEASGRWARRPSWSRTTCPTGWNSSSELAGQEHLARGAGRRSRSTAAISTARPRPALKSAGEVDRRTGRRAPRFCRLPLRPLRRAGRDRPAARSTACRTTDADGRATLPASVSTRCRRRRVRSKRASPCGSPKPAAARSSASSRCRSTATGPMIGVRPLFSGRSLGEGEQATFDVVVVGARRRGADAHRPALRAAARSRPATSGIAATTPGTSSR